MQAKLLYGRGSRPKREQENAESPWTVWRCAVEGDCFSRHNDDYDNNNDNNDDDDSSLAPLGLKMNVCNFVLQQKSIADAYEPQHRPSVPLLDLGTWIWGSPHQNGVTRGSLLMPHTCPWLRLCSARKEAVLSWWNQRRIHDNYVFWKMVHQHDSFLPININLVYESEPVDHKARSKSAKHKRTVHLVGCDLTQGTLKSVRSMFRFFPDRDSQFFN